MKWLLGLDLRNRCGGPLHLARLLHEPVTGHATVEALHVVEAEQRELFAAAKLGDAVAGLARREMEGVVARAGARAQVDALTLIERGEPESVLAQVARDGAFDGILLGRAAPRGEDPIVRLGRVARRLARELPTAIIVTPPDLEAAAVGKGPIVLATEAGEHSSGAVRFALALEKELGREMIVVHVADMVLGWGEDHLPKETLQYAWSQFGADAQRRLERWAGVHGLAGHRSIVGSGWVPGEVERIARNEDACLIVCGSRQLHLVSRVFVNSVGTELAAQADRPVALVPNDWHAVAILPPSAGV